jgi:hypothetical protein
MKHFIYPPIWNVVAALLAFTAIERLLLFIYSECLFSEVLIRLSIPDVHKFMLINVPERLITLAARVYITVHKINSCGNPSKIAWNGSIQLSCINTSTEHSQKIADIVANVFILEISLRLCKLHYYRVNLLSR